MSNVADILTTRGRQVEAELTRFCDALTHAVPRRLLEAIRYSLFAGGKRLRPTLVLEWAEAICDSRFAICDSEPPIKEPLEAGGCSARFGSGFGVGDPNEITHRTSHIANPSALAAAGAIELIHTFSLVHDDLPAMDNDDLRRGRPTNHKVFGDALAILAGDAMTTLAFELLATRADPTIAPMLIAELARASGPAGMIGGQVIDIESEHLALPIEQLQTLHAMKTGALLRASCRLGAISAGADDATLDAATRYGQHLGLAFQIMDDVLDVTSSAEHLGKATGKDQSAGKNTYPQLIGLEASRAMAREQVNAALAAISVLGSRSDRLGALAKYVVERDR